MSARRRRSGGGLGLAAITLFLVTALVLAAMWVGSKRKQVQVDAVQEVEEPADAAEAPVDPFAVLGEERPDGDDDDPFGADEERRTPDPGELTGGEVFQAALALSERGQRFRTSASGARAQGREQEAKEYERQALAAFEEALRSTDAWVRDEVSRFEPSSLQVLSVHSTRERWRDQTNQLRRNLAR